MSSERRISEISLRDTEKFVKTSFSRLISLKSIFLFGEKTEWKNSSKRSALGLLSLHVLSPK